MFKNIFQWNYTAQSNHEVNHAMTEIMLITG